MPPASQRITLLSATSLASAVAVGAAQQAKAAVIYSVQVRNPNELTQTNNSTLTVLSVTDVLGRPAGNGALLASTNTAYSLVGASTVRTVTVTRRSSTQTNTTTLTIGSVASTDTGATFAATLSDNTLPASGTSSRTISVTLTPSVRSGTTTTISNTFTLTGTNPASNSGTSPSWTYVANAADKTNFTFNTIAVAPVSSTTATGTTLYALPGGTAQGTVNIQNVGDGSYLTATLTGTLTSTLSTGFSGSVANGNFGLRDGAALAGKVAGASAATTLTQTLTYTGQSARGVSSTATVTAAFANGSTDNTNKAHSSVTTFTGTTVAPVQSVTTGGPNVYALPGQTVTRDFTIKNIGDGSLAGATLNGTTSNTLGSGFASVTATGSFALNDGVSGPAATTLTHTITYTGQSTRGTTSTATVTAAFSNGNSAGTNASQTVTQTFKAQVVAPVASTTAAPTSLGTVRVGTTSTGTLTVKNIGDGNLAGADNGTTLLSNLRGTVSVSGNSAFTGGGAVNLTDSSSQTYMFTYAPTARGTQSGTITTALTNGAANGTNAASTASSTVTGTAVGPDYDAAVKGSGTIINGGTILFGEYAGGLTLQDLLISNLSNDVASKALTDLTLTNVTITGSTEFSFSLSGFDSGNTGSYGTSTKNAVLSNLQNGDGQGAISIQFVSKTGGFSSALLRIETDEGAALGGAGAVYVYNLVWSVPEPGTIAVFGAGLLGLAISRQRRRGRAFTALTAKPEEDTQKGAA